MSRSKVAVRCLKELLLILSISMVPIGFGLMMMLYQHDQKHQEHAHGAAAFAIDAVDQVMDRLHMNAEKALILAGRPCDSVKPRLLAQIDGARYLRGLALTRDGQLYCKTLATPNPPPARHDDETRAHLQLVFGSAATPNAVHVAYRLRRDNFSAIASAYALELRNLLRGPQGTPTVVLEIGEGYITADSDSRDGARPSLDEFAHTAFSQKYGYSVTAGYPAGYSAQRTRQTLLLTLPALVLIGVTTGLIAYWSIFCHQGQRNRTAVSSC